MLCPDGVLSESVKYVLSLALLLSVIGAAGITVKMPKFDFSAFSTESGENEALTAASAEYVFSYMLTSADINFSEITVCTNKSENDGIVISKVIIRSDCERDKIAEAIGGISSDYEVEIINE